MHRLALAVASIFAACGAPVTERASAVSTASPGAGGGSEVDPDVACRDEAPTGSSISHQVCRSKDQSDDQRQDARDFLHQPHTVQAPPTP
ncbi:MAG: hypothetical protein ABIY55_19695 [Kofleriaceae bacterium]